VRYKSLKHFSNETGIDYNKCILIREMMKESVPFEETGKAIQLSRHQVWKVYKCVYYLDMVEYNTTYVKAGYWSNEKELERSFNPVYSGHDLKGWELEMFNKISN